MKNDLIWVYEEFTQYYGNVLAARAGFRSTADTVSAFDFEAFQLDRPGRHLSLGCPLETPVPVF